MLRLASTVSMLVAAALASGCRLAPQRSDSGLAEDRFFSGPFMSVAKGDEWGGQIFLPLKAYRSGGRIVMRVSAAPPEQSELLGTYVFLRPVKPDQDNLDYRPGVAFVAEEREKAKGRQWVLPTLLDGWDQVSALESLAASRCHASQTLRVTVKEHSIEVCDYGRRDRLFVQIRQGLFTDADHTLGLVDEPLLVGGTHYVLARSLKRDSGLPDAEDLLRFTAEPFIQGAFEGSTMRLALLDPKADGPRSQSLEGLNDSAAAAQGWYIYGEFEKDPSSSRLLFVGRAIEPRAPQRLDAPYLRLDGTATAKAFVRYQDRAARTQPILEQQGLTTMAQRSMVNGFRHLHLVPDSIEDGLEAPLKSVRYDGLTRPFIKGEQGLVVRLQHGVTDKDKNAGVGPLGLVVGRLAYGTYQVAWEPLAQESRYELNYYEVIGHNRRGVVAARTARHEYLGSLVRGWGNAVGVTDALIRLTWIGEPLLGAGKIADEVPPVKIISNFMAEAQHAARTGFGDGVTSEPSWLLSGQDATAALLAAFQLVESRLCQRARQPGRERKGVTDCDALSRLSQEILSAKLLAGSPYPQRKSTYSPVKRPSNFFGDDFGALHENPQSLPRTIFNGLVSTALVGGIDVVLLDQVQIGGTFTREAIAAGLSPIAATSLVDAAPVGTKDFAAWWAVAEKKLKKDGAPATLSDFNATAPRD